SEGPSDDRIAGVPNWTLHERPWRVGDSWHGTPTLRYRRLRCLARKLGATDTQHTLRRKPCAAKASVLLNCVSVAVSLVMAPTISPRPIDSSGRSSECRT